jgi:hypothetical protein
MTFNAGTANGTGSGNTGGSITFSGGSSSSAANAGDLIFSGGSCGVGSFSGFRGGNVVITSGSSDQGPAGSFTCQTALGSTGSGPVTFQTGDAFGGKSGDINLITGISGFTTPEDAGNLIYTGGATGSDDEDFSGTAGGGIFTGGYGSGSAGVGGSFTFTAGGGTGTNGSINLATVSGTSIQLADSSGARQLGFFGATPVAKPTSVAVTAAGIHAALVSLGLIS